MSNIDHRLRELEEHAGSITVPHIGPAVTHISCGIGTISKKGCCRWVMSNPVQQNEVQLNRIHIRAVCEEMGERLSGALGPQSTELPPHLRSLMKQLAKVDLAKSPRHSTGFEGMKDCSNVFSA